MKPREYANPKNRFLSTEIVYEQGESAVNVEILEDSSRSILSSNDSPDVGFKWSVNPYRGCLHACAYCYARPSHEYLGFGAGTDFETKIMAKTRAPELLREAFEKPKWEGELIVFSGVTDCYQPAEAKLKLTRGCLEVCAEYRNPIGIITKSLLVERDIDVLQDLTKNADAKVNVSIPFFDADKARAMEPYVATPERRLQLVEKLAKAGVRVGVSVSPIIPGLNDEDVPRVLEAARDAGAVTAFYVLLRLPGAVKDVFEQRLREKLPERAERVLHRIRETRGGELYQSEFGTRGRGTGLYAKVVKELFEKTASRLGLNSERSEPDVHTFRRPPKPPKKGEQLKLF